MSSVLITGANRGLGLEFTRQYLKDGWEVYAFCRQPNEAAELGEIISQSKIRNTMEMNLLNISFFNIVFKLLIIKKKINNYWSIRF